MVEALIKDAEITANNDEEMKSDGEDVDVISKPRTKFSNNVLRQVVNNNNFDLKSRKASLS